MSGFSSRTSGTPLHPINQAQSVPRLAYFISRTNGTLVPLVPADELPSNIRIKGLPRTLNSDQTFGLQHVSTLPYTGLTFGLEYDAIKPQQTSSQSHDFAYTGIDRESDETLSYPPWPCTPHLSAGYNMPKEASGSHRSASRHEVAEDWRARPATSPQAVIDAIVGTKSGAETAAQIGYRPSRSIAPSSVTVATSAEKKEYCSYWLRTGECDYVQQGCRYKHEMPDRSTLQKLGFRNIPRWWLEKDSMIKLASPKADQCTTLSYPALLRTTKNQDIKYNVSKAETSDDDSSNGDSLEVEFTPYKRKLDPTILPATAKSTSNAFSRNNQVQERKQSMMSDLIDFKPLIPTPSSSVSSAEPSTSEDDHTEGHTSLISAPKSRSRSTSKSKDIPDKVFVPRGESSDIHITEAEKINIRRPKKRDMAEVRRRFHEARADRRLPRTETIASKIARRSRSIVQEPR